MSAIMPMTSGPPPEPIQGTAITPYQAYGAPPAAYPLRPASPRSPVREPPPPYPRAHPPPGPGPGMTRSPTVTYRAPPPMTSGSGTAPRTASSAQHPGERSPPKPASPSLSVTRGRRHSLTVAGLTAPYNPETTPSSASESMGSPPKNYSAQTKAPPGPRLRSSPPPGPATSTVEASPHLRIHIVDTRRRVPV